MSDGSRTLTRPRTARPARPSRPTGFLSPYELAKAYREEHPKLFDDLDDAELIAAIRDEDPDTYNLLDPLMEGAELLSPPAGAQPYTDPRLVPPPPPAPVALATATRVAPAVAGSIAGSFLGPWGTYAGGAIGAGLGEAGAQWLESEAGPREAYSPGSMAFQTALGAINPTARATTMLGRTAIQTGYGAMLGGVGGAGTRRIETGEWPTFPEFGRDVAIGAATGGLLHGTFEGGMAGARVLDRRAGAGLGDLTGGMPSAGNQPMRAEGPVQPGAPVPSARPVGAYVGAPPPRMARAKAADQLIVAQAADRQYQTEEAQLAAGLQRTFGDAATRPAGAPDYHTAVQAKSYLEQLAEHYRRGPLLQSLHDTLGTAIEGPPPPPPPPTLPPALPPGGGAGPGQAGPPLGPFVGYPPGVLDLFGVRGLAPGQQALPPAEGALRVPGTFIGGPAGGGGQFETIGSSAPPIGRMAISGPALPPSDGGGGIPVQPTDELAPVGTPPPSFELSAQSDVPRGTAQPAQPWLIPPPRLDTRGPIAQQPVVGGAPPTRDQPYLGAPGGGRTPILEPKPLDRTYPEGPNAGPRREPAQEAHGKPRTLRRQVQREGKTTYETYPSAHPAEDPGTYPPEVRRELAAIAWELENYRYERHQGGYRPPTANQARKAGDTRSETERIADSRRSGATSGGATPGAPVYHDIIESAGGAFKHVKREEMLRQIRAALLEGRGTGLTDAAAQVARSRLRQRTAPNPDADAVTALKAQVKEAFEAGDMARVRELNEDLQMAQRRLAMGARERHTLLAKHGTEGDDLIGWTDADGTRTLPDQDLDEFQRAARDIDDNGELLSLARMTNEDVPESALPYLEAARAEAVRRGLLDPDQLALVMEGPGGDKGPSLFDFEGGPAEPSPTRTTPDGPVSAGGSRVGAPPPGPPGQAGPPSAARSRVADLEAKASEEALGVRVEGEPGFDPEVAGDKGSYFHGDTEGRSPVNCTHCAERFLETSGERGEIYGWADEDNPTATVAEGMGHDFAVVEDRYLVDPWAHQVDATTPKAVFDLLDPADRAFVTANYGDPSTWIRRTETGGDYEWVPDTPTPLRQTGDVGTPPPSQPALPGAEGVRAQNIPTPEVADLPFALTPPPAKPRTVKEGRTTAERPPLLQRLFEEEGVLVLTPPPPHGDRQGLKKWLKQQEDEHGGDPWFSRVEQHIADGNWDAAWKAASAASVRSYARALSQAPDERQRAAIERSVRGTALQDDLGTQIIAGARARAGVGTAPPVKGMPPSVSVSQAAAARGRATLGPAGIINPGPRQRPLSTQAPELRGATLDTNVVRLLLEEIEGMPGAVEGMSTLRGNTDTALRLFRQAGEVIYRSRNLQTLREAGVDIDPQSLAQHFNATISDYGRGLNLVQQFLMRNQEVLEEAGEAMSMGGMLSTQRQGSYAGRGRGTLSAAGQQATQEVVDAVADRTTNYHAAALANDLQKRRPVGPLQAIHDASYAFMLSKWNTALRNYVSVTGRYGVEALDHALTIPIARLLGDESAASLSTALLKERGVIMPGRTGTKVVPWKGGRADDLQTIYDFTIDRLNELKPEDARRAIRLLLDTPERAAEYLGTLSGEDLRAAFVNTPVLRHLTNPAVQRFLTMFNRAQEFSARATVFDATVRGHLRARGLDPTAILSRPTPEVIQAVGGPQAFDDLMFAGVSAAMEATFAGRTAKDSIPGAIIRAFNSVWPAKLAMPFPRFNLSAAPRWLYDHSPAALLDWIRFPLDRAGITARPGTAGGGRLYRGVRAQEILQTDLPAIRGRIAQAERTQGTALQELLATQREFSIRARQIARLEGRAQQGLPGAPDLLTQAREAQAQLARRRDTLKTTIRTQRSVVTDLKSTERTLLNRVEDAVAINAPNHAQLLARMATGTVGMLGAAMIVRSQDGARGNRWYEFTVQRGEGQDPVVLDFRPFAPFAQYLFVADVALDFLNNTDWDAVHSEVLTEEEGSLASPLDWSRSMWNHYEGKYTAGELGAQFGQAFLSISRAAGTTLTLVDLMTQNGWPGPQNVADAIIGTLGQLLSRFTVPLQQITDVVGQFDEEEAKLRQPPKATLEEPTRPLASTIGNIPFARQVIPERVSQTTGEPVAAEYPLLRGLAGIGTAPRDFVVEEVRRVGVPGQSVFIRETGDYGLDRLVAERYSALLKEHLPGILESEQYQQLRTPARQRDFLQRYVFPPLKRGALLETHSMLGTERFEEATVRGEEARYRDRRARMIEDLIAEEPEDPAAEVGAPPPAAPAF